MTVLEQYFGPQEPPSRPVTVTRYQKLTLDPDEMAPNYMSLLCLAFSSIAFLLDLKVMAWMSFFSFLSMLLTLRESEKDYMQLTIVFVCVSSIVAWSNRDVSFL